MSVLHIFRSYRIRKVDQNIKEFVFCEKNPKLEEPKIFMMVSKHACPLLWRRHYLHLSRLFTVQTLLKRWSPQNDNQWLCSWDMQKHYWPMADFLLTNSLRVVWFLTWLLRTHSENAQDALSSRAKRFLHILTLEIQALSLLSYSMSNESPNPTPI